MRKANRKLVVHYDEIAIKGKNRTAFEKQLVANLKRLFHELSIDAETQNSWGRIFIKAEFSDETWQQVKKRLTLFPGVSNFGFAFVSDKSWDDLKKLAGFFVDTLKDGSFRVSCKRVDKSFSKNSQEIEREFGAALFELEPHLKVDLKNYDLELRIEVLHNEILAYINYRGLGGLPVKSSGRAVALLSAGFDSPVASFMMMRRGVEIYPIHFHAEEKVGPEALQAVKDLKDVLSKMQPEMSLALVDVFKIQKYIVKEAPEKLRIVLVRRVFNRIASKYAKSLGALALVTGESVGQVASQTLENILVSNDASSFPILRPLSGMNKEEIIQLSRKIGTHDISARPCDDTCSLFLPKSPETKASLEKVTEIERVLPELKELEEEAYGDMLMI